MMPADLLDAHPHVKVLTLDFFDTLVTRAVAQPTHVFAVMEEILLGQHGPRWRGFAVRRVEAELRARSVMAGVDGNADITLGDILRELAVDFSLSPDERLQLSELEQDCEVRLAVRVQFGTGLLEEAVARGLRVFVVSDNYMPASHIVRMAAAVGVHLERSQIFVSCEHGAMKHDGSLWAHVLETVGVEPGEILHVGDLPDADGTVPARWGIATHVNGDMRRSHREPLNTCPALLPLSRMEAESRDRAARDDWDAVLNLAQGALALLVAAQVLDIERVARERVLAGVHFTSRDGFLAREVYSGLRQVNPELPAPGYTEVSRSITWRALLDEMNPETAHRFVGDDEELSLRMLSKRFGCDLHGAHDPDARLDPSTARDVLVRNATPIVASCRSLRARLMSYLDANGVTTPGHHVLMDLGWSGSVVTDLAQIVRAERGNAATFEGRLTGVYWDATPNRRRIPIHGLAFDEFMSMDDNVRMLGMIRLFESLLTAPHGSVVDYADGVAVHSSGYVVPEIAGLSWGAIAATTCATAGQIVRGVHPLVRREDVTRDAVRSAMLQVGHTPTHAEVTTFSTVGHESAIDHAGGGTPLVSEFPGNVAAEDIPNIYDVLLRKHWTQGTLEAWSADDSTRWVADEVRRFGPMMKRKWVGP